MNRSQSEVSKNYLREQIKLSASLLDRKYSKGPKFYAHTFSVKKGAFLEYAEKIDAFLDALASESNNEPQEEILQLNVQFFGLLDRL